MNCAINIRKYLTCPATGFSSTPTLFPHFLSPLSLSLSPYSQLTSDWHPFRRCSSCNVGRAQVYWLSTESQPKKKKKRTRPRERVSKSPELRVRHADSFTGIPAQYFCYFSYLFGIFCNSFFFGIVSCFAPKVASSHFLLEFLWSTGEAKNGKGFKELSTGLEYTQYIPNIMINF